MADPPPAEPTGATPAGPPDSGTLTPPSADGPAQRTKIQESPPTHLLLPPEPALPVVPGYEVTGEIARGGMGVVYAARDLTLGREVAIKTLLPGIAGEDAARRFVREAAITARLPHPAIPPVHALGELPDGTPFLAMKLIRGKTLAELLKERPDAGHDLPRFVAVFERVCQAVAFAHAQGVVHRDLKPHNVMVGDFGEVQVMDWGLAKAGTRSQGPGGGDRPDRGAGAGAAPGGAGDVVASDAADDATAAGAVIGTPAFMSPEQARGDPDTARPAVDVFGLGATLFVILTGRPPLRGRADDVLALAREGMIPTPRSVNPRVPGALDAVCRKAMAPDPAARYPSARELEEDVGRWLRDEAVGAWREPPAERLRRWANKHRAAALGLLAVLATAAVGLAAGLWSVERQREETAAERDRKEEALTDANREHGVAIENEKRAKEAQAAAERSAADARHQAELAGRSAYSLQLSRAAGLTATEPQTAYAFLHDVRLVPPQRREFGWGALNRLADVGTTVAAAHAGPIESFAFSPDGARLATGGLKDGAVCVWDVGTWKRLARWDGFPSAVTALAFSPDGAELAVACGKAWRAERITLTFEKGKPRREFSMNPGATPPTAVRVLDAATGRVRRELAGNRNGVLSVAWGRLGLVAAGGEDGSLRVWDAASGHQLAERPHARPVTAVAFAAGGRRLVSGGEDQRVRVWDAGAGLAGHLGPLAGLGSPWAGVAAAALPLPTNLEKPRAVHTQHEGAVTAIATSANFDGYLSVDTVGSVQSTANATGVHRPLEDLGASAYGAASDRTSRTIAFCTQDTLRVWVMDRAGNARKADFTKTPSMAKVGVHPTRPVVVTGGEAGELVVWDLSPTPNGRMIAHWNYDAFALSADGRLLAAASGNTGQIELRDPRTLGLIRESPRLTGSAEALRFSADGATLFALHAWTSYKNESVPATLRAWDTRTMTERYHVPCGSGYWKGFDVHPGTNRVALGGSTGVVAVYDGADGRLVRQFDRLGETVSHVAFSPDGRWLAAGTAAPQQKGRPTRPGETVVWDLTAGARTDLTLPGVADRVEHLGWGPNSDRLLVAWSPEARPSPDAACWGVWDVPGRRWAVRPSDPRPGVRAFAFAADGSAVLVGRTDRRVERYDARTGAGEWVGPRLGGDVQRVAWSPDGRTIAVATSGARGDARDALYTLDPVLGLEQVRLPLENSEGCQFLRFLPGSDVLVAGRKWRVHTWDGRP